MKVAVVYPEVYNLGRFQERRRELPPFGALYLAAAMESDNITVRVFKASPSADTSLDLRDFDAVAFSIPSSVTYSLMRRARFDSIYSERALIMAGGLQPSLYPEQTLLDMRPDVIGIGPGEETILELLQQSETRRFHKVDGICYLDNSVPRRTRQRKLKRDISHIPLPARHLLEESDFIMHNRLAGTNLRMTHILSSRGCPFDCRFCACPQKKMQFRSGYSIRTELEHLVRNYDIEGFVIVDDNFTVNRDRVSDVCNAIRDLHLKWSLLSRVDTVDYELLEPMRTAGCIEIKFGMESGSEELLREMGKNITRAHIRSAVTQAFSVGIKVKVFLLHGFPGENSETTEDTISLLDDLSPMISRVSLFRFVPLPGSYVYENASDFNLLVPQQGNYWDNYHINHNQLHWWGSEQDYDIMTQAYNRLNTFVERTWPQVPDYMLSHL